MFKRTITIILWAVTLAGGAAFAQQAPNPTQRSIDPAPGPTPIFRVTIVGRTTAVNPEMVTDPRTPDRIASLYSQNGLSFDGAVVLNWPRALVEVRRSIAAGSSLSDVRVRLGRLLESASG